MLNPPDIETITGYPRKVVAAGEWKTNSIASCSTLAFG